MRNAAELLTKSSYCRNSKHAKCKTLGCECKCHALPDATVSEAEYVAAKQASIDASIAETEALQAEATAELADAVQDRADAEPEAQAPTFVQPDADETKSVEEQLAEIVSNIDGDEIEDLRDKAFAETGCAGCAESDFCDIDPPRALDAITAAQQLILDRLDPSKAPAPAPKPAKKPRAPKAPKEPKPVVKGTVDGKLSNAHKRAIRIQMVAYLAAMPVELTGDLEGVTPDEAAAYVDQYWVKYIDPARDKARHSK